MTKVQELIKEMRDLNEYAVDPNTTKLLDILDLYHEALDGIREKTTTDPAEGPELRARAALVHLIAGRALAKAEEILR